MFIKEYAWSKKLPIKCTSYVVLNKLIYPMLDSIEEVNTYPTSFYVFIDKGAVLAARLMVCRLQYKTGCNIFRPDKTPVTIGHWSKQHSATHHHSCLKTHCPIK